VWIAVTFLITHMDKLQELGFRLGDASRLYTKRLEERGQILSLHPAQCKVLVLLAENEGVSQSRLSEISEIAPPRLVGILDRLEADGWVRRHRRPGDRRMWSLAVTANAKPILRRVWIAIGETCVEALHGLSTDEIGTLVKALECVHSNLSACKPLGADPLDTIANEVTARGQLRLVP
jgi:DNA-binding MarR family transcriptional regulator